MIDKRPLKNTLNSVIKLIRKRVNKKFPKTKIKTGFDRIDECFIKGNLIIIAGTNGVGKTSLALNITKNLAIKENKNVGYISLDVSKEKIIQRLISFESLIYAWKIRGGFVGEKELKSIEKIKDKISNASIFIEDLASPSFVDIKKVIKELNNVRKLDLVFIDYLQLIRNKAGYTPIQMTKTLEKIKILAVELNIPIVLLVQVEDDVTLFPILTTLRRVGNVEKISDVILFINRTVEQEDGSNAEILVEKNNNGRLGKINVFFDALLSSFKKV